MPRLKRAGLCLGLILLLGVVPVFPGNAAFGASEAAAQSGDDFDFELFHVLTRGNKNNVLVSPVSARMALAMTLNGADGKTYQEMAAVLRVPSGGLSQFNQSNQNALGTLENDEKLPADNQKRRDYLYAVGVPFDESAKAIGKKQDELYDKYRARLNIANAIFADSHTPFNQEFIQRCSQSYRAEARNLDFKNTNSAAEAINKWCSDKTQTKIPTIVDASDLSGTVMVLLNAVYFKGAWAAPFFENETTDGQFTTATGEHVAVKMMNQTEDFRYFKGDHFQSVELPYCEGKQSMFLFLPDRDSSLSAFLNKFHSAEFKTWKQKFQDQQVVLSVPRFKVETSAGLNDALEAMGMRNAFVPSANFSKLSQTHTYIGKVLQKTYMDVNEKGTEAAASTEVSVLCAAHFGGKEFRVDRPFALALVDDRTGEIVFLGAIWKP
jgi:serpin B